MEKQCFIIAPIGTEGSDTRKRSDMVLQHVYKPPLEAAGYNVVRADTIDDPGLITAQVLDRILNDDLVLADLSEHNPNVFYELAVRHAVRKPLIQVIKTGEKVPFDIADMRTIIFDHTDLNSVAEAKSLISKQIDAIEESGTTVQSPISMVVNLKSLESSGDRDEMFLSKMVSKMVGQLARIEKRIDGLEKPHSGPDLDDEIPF